MTPLSISILWILTLGVFLLGYFFGNLTQDEEEDDDEDYY